MTYRVQFDIPDEDWENMKNLMKKCGFDTRKDLFTNAYALLEWAVDERTNNRILGSVDMDTTAFSQVTMPFLNRLNTRNNLSKSFDPTRKYDPNKRDD